MARETARRDRKLRCGRHEAESRGTGSAEPCREAQNEDRFFYQRADAVVRRLFMAGSDLHTVRSRVEDTAAALHSTAQIDDAIRKVDAAINDLRHMIFELQSGHENGQGRLRMDIG